MVELTYMLGAFFAVLLGAALGFAGHFARAHFSYHPERITGSDMIDDILSDEDIMFESQVIGAKWDDYGFWDAESNRNLVYYVLSGMASTLFLAIWFWPDRIAVVAGFCRFTAWIGFSSPMC